MKFLDRLERIFRPFAIPNLTQVLIAGQVVLLIASFAQPGLLAGAPLVWNEVLKGEFWRLLTFLIVPFRANPLWLFFACYIFYLFGNSLQAIWGYVRYNAFLWLGILLTIAAAALVRDQPVTGHFLYLTVFLAFATYNPEFEIRLMFVLPIKVKYLAYFQVAYYLLQLVNGSNGDRVMVIASIGNYLIFFAPALFQRIRNVQRKVQWESKQYKPGNKPRHVCATCGINSNTHPRMDFRYCSKCDGELAYCEEHLRNHECVRAKAETTS